MRDSTPTSVHRVLRRRAAAPTMLLVAALLGATFAVVSTAPASALPSQTPPSAGGPPPEPPAVPVPLTAVPADVTPSAAAVAASCTLVDTTRTCDLWVRSGTVLIPNHPDPVPVWTFADTENGTLSYPGPVIILESDESLVVNLHHRGAAVGAASLSVPRAPVAPDVTGITNTQDATYTFGPFEPGTYTYQAGPTPDGARQIAMGMAGVIVVRPDGFDSTAPTAYGTGDPVPFDDELIVAVSEIDPRFNADPDGFDLSFFNPTLFLVNGAPYPTPALDLQPGHNVYVRYANLGIQHRSMQLVGVRQLALAAGSQRLPAPVDVAVQALPPGQVADTLVHLPVANNDLTVPLLDAGLHLHNGADGATAGMLSLLHLPDQLAGVAAGPATSGVSTTPAVVTGADPLDVSAVITSGAAGGVADAEYLIDDLERDPVTGLLLNGTPMALTSPGAASTVALGTIGPAQLAALANGEHTVWVHGLDANGWGFVSATTFVIDRDGPVVHGIELTPAIGDGTTLHVQATADSTLTGTGTDIQEVRYAIDAPPTAPGDGTFLTAAPFPNSPNPARASVAADIDLSTLGLTDGPHTLYLEALDSAGPGHWSQVATPTTFMVDTVGPEITAVAVDVTPNNGTIAAQGPLGFLDAVRVSADATDVGSGIVAAEVSIGTTAAAPGTGDAMLSTLASWGHGSPGAYAESVYADLPLAAVRSMAEGDHTIWVRARDEAGSWGPAVATVLRLDKTAPTVTLTAGPLADQVTIGAQDPVSGGVNTDIVVIEHFVGDDPGVGLATALVPGVDFTVGTTVSVLRSGFSSGDVVGVRARDDAGTWSATTWITVP